MVWYFFVFRQVPRRYAEICYSRTYIFLLAITSRPAAKVFKTVKNLSCTCKFHASDIFWDEKSQKVIFALDQKIFSAHPIIFFNTIDRATLFSPGGCGLLVQRAKMASVVTIIIEPKFLNSSVGNTHL